MNTRPTPQVTPRQNPKPIGVVSNAAGLIAGFGASQVAPEADTEIATFARVVGASAAASLLGARVESTPVTWGMMLVSGVHGYHRCGGSLPYAFLWALAGSAGVGVALGQGFGELPKHMRGAPK